MPRRKITQPCLRHTSCNSRSRSGNLHHSPKTIVRYPIHPRFQFGCTGRILLASAAPPDCTSAIMVNCKRHKISLALSKPCGSLAGHRPRYTASICSQKFLPCTTHTALPLENHHLSGACHANMALNESTLSPVEPEVSVWTADHYRCTSGRPNRSQASAQQNFPTEALPYSIHHAIQRFFRRTSS